MEEIKEKKKQTSLKHYNVENPSQSEEIKKKKENTYFKHYNVFHYFQTKESQENRKSQYLYNNLNFDSKPEVCFYIYCTDHNLNIKRSPSFLEYNFEGQIHRYFPDFEINRKFYEIKGPHFLNENGKWSNPFDSSLNNLFEAKHQCALKNNVRILYYEDYKVYLDYIIQKYGSLDYLQQFKKK